MYINYIKNTFNFLFFSFQLFFVQLLRNLAYNLVSNIIILYRIGQPTKIGSCLVFFLFKFSYIFLYITCHSTNEVYRENENLELQTKITYETALSRMKFRISFTEEFKNIYICVYICVIHLQI